jgi:hypothetical protein
MSRTYLTVVALLVAVALYVLIVGTAPLLATAVALAAVAVGATGWSRSHRAA